ncbi:uncharacterized protein LOC114828096 [Galendromus occidentalis]|uniref:Uncharacterized protein LOC114828096 n=1 Tax=Galendromus occidentalis TaxID=34638 RepID=A0AAJ7WI09_9ACAR|nr:uncharacterized protein LOC114828096 [Galendromus occidentalis]
MWFTTIEAQFSIRKISEDQTKFESALTALDSDTQERVADFFDDLPAPGSQYAQFKARVLDSFKVDQHQRLANLVALTIGDDTPTRLLDGMLALYQPDINAERNPLFRFHFLQKLPSNVREQLMAQDHLELRDLAKLADKIVAQRHLPTACTVQEEDEIDAVRRMIPPKKFHRGPFAQKDLRACRFHVRFGDKARNCLKPRELITSEPEKRVFGMPNEEIKMLSANASAPSSFEKLSGADNYMNWRFAMEAHLFNTELWEYVDRSKIDARQEKERVPRGLYREVALLEELTSIRYSDCPSMEENLNRKVTAAQRLRAIDSNLKDRLLAGLILMKLPEEFTPLIQSISGCDQDISTEFVKERLLAEAARQNLQKQENALSSNQFRTSHRHPPQRDSRPNVRTPRKKFRGRCNRCGRIGHMAKHCDNSGAQGRIAEVLQPDERVERVLKCSPASPTEWIVDSGATSHMTGQRTLFLSLSEEVLDRSVATANDEMLRCEGIGDVQITCVFDDGECPVRLRDALYVPGLTVNLISVKQLTAKGFSVTFDKSGRCEMRNFSGHRNSYERTELDTRQPSPSHRSRTGRPRWSTGSSSRKPDHCLQTPIWSRSIGLRHSTRPANSKMLAP